MKFDEVKNHAFEDYLKTVVIAELANSKIRSKGVESELVELRL